MKIKLLVVGAIAALIARPTTDCWPARKGDSKQTKVAPSTNYHVGEAAAVLAVAVQAPLFGDAVATEPVDFSAALDGPSSLDNLLSAVSRTHDAPFTAAEIASLAKFMNGDVPMIADGALPFGQAGGNSLASVGGRRHNALSRGRSGAGGSGDSSAPGAGGGAPQGLPQSALQQVPPGIGPMAPGMGDVPNPTPPSDLADSNPAAQTPENYGGVPGDEPSWNPPANQPYIPPVAVLQPDPISNGDLPFGPIGDVVTMPTIESLVDLPRAPASEDVAPLYPPMSVTLPPVGLDAVPEPATFAVWAGLGLAAGCFAWRKHHR